MNPNPNRFEFPSETGYTVALLDPRVRGDDDYAVPSTVRQVSPLPSEGSLQNAPSFPRTREPRGKTVQPIRRRFSDGGLSG